MTRKKILLISGFGLFLVLLAYLLCWPVSIKPVAWEASRSKGYVNAFTENSALDNLSFIRANNFVGPEDITFDSNGNLYSGYQSGQIMRFSNRSGQWVGQFYANTHGRPLGMRFGSDNRLFVADSTKGLLSISSAGEVKVLVDQYEGKKLLLVDHLDIAESGIIYFSDASNKFGIDDAAADIIEHAGRGRVFSYDLNTGITKLVLSHLNFANGIALSKDESYLLISETGGYRILKYYLKGSQQGTFEVLHNNLPGLPDNISRDENGNFWVGLVLTRNPMLDLTSSFPFLRQIMYRIPQRLHLNPKAVTHAIQIDGMGKACCKVEVRTLRWLLAPFFTKVFSI